MWNPTRGVQNPKCVSMLGFGVDSFKNDGNLSEESTYISKQIQARHCDNATNVGMNELWNC
jgi:hypothetical protein